MFPAERETVLAVGGGIGGRLATRFAPAGLPSFRSGVGAEVRLGAALLAGPPSAAERSAARGGA